MQLNLEGVAVGVIALAMIGVFHPIVIKCEYYFSSRVWPVFLLLGVLSLGAALFTDGLVSIVLGLLGVSCLWSIQELKEQTQRVKKGWFPCNPSRKDPPEK